MNGQLKQTVTKVSRNRRFRYIFFGLVVLTLLLGVAMVPIEVREGRGGNITNWQDGIWWAATTVTGGAFGDYFPVTNTGRIIGIILEILGAVLFGSIIAIVSVELLRYQEDYYMRRVFGRIDLLEIELKEMRKYLDFLVKEKTGKK